MSDALILGLATIISATIVTPVIAWMIRRSENRIKAKVEVYHKEVNGHMAELLKTTKNLGHAEGKVEGKAEEKAESKKAPFEA